MSIYNIDTSNNNGSFLTKEYILSNVSEYDIFSYYLKFNFEIGKVYSSPLRIDDTNPSFGIFRSKSGTLIFKDLAKPDLCGDCFKFVKLMLNKRTYKEAIIDIYINLLLSGISIKKDKQEEVKRFLKNNRKKDIAIHRVKFKEFDLNYWKQYNITEEILKKFNVYKTSEVYVDDKLVKVSKEDNPIYAYKTFNSFTIYSPLELNKKNKWLSNKSLFDIGGYEQLPETGDLLIISKAIKDVMFLYSIGIHAITPSSETSSIPDNVIDILKGKFKRIVIFLDNDEAGIEAAKKLNKKYNLEYVHIPVTCGTKDLTDFCKTFGVQETIKLFEYLIDGSKENYK